MYSRRRWRGALSTLGCLIGNYLTGYLGTFYEKMPREMFFVLLGGLGLAAGLAIFALGKPLRNAMGRKV